MIWKAHGNNISVVRPIMEKVIGWCMDHYIKTLYVCPVGKMPAILQKYYNFKPATIDKKELFWTNGKGNKISLTQKQNPLHCVETLLSRTLRPPLMTIR